MPPKKKRGGHLAKLNASHPKGQQRAGSDDGSDEGFNPDTSSEEEDSVPSSKDQSEEQQRKRNREKKQRQREKKRGSNGKLPPRPSMPPPTLHSFFTRPTATPLTAAATTPIAVTPAKPAVPPAAQPTSSAATLAATPANPSTDSRWSLSSSKRTLTSVFEEVLAMQLAATEPSVATVNVAPAISLVSPTLSVNGVILGRPRGSVDNLTRAESSASHGGQSAHALGANKHESSAQRTANRQQRTKRSASEPPPPLPDPESNGRGLTLAYAAGCSCCPTFRRRWRLRSCALLLSDDSIDATWLVACRCQQLIGSFFGVMHGSCGACMPWPTGSHCEIPNVKASVSSRLRRKHRVAS